MLATAASAPIVQALAAVELSVSRIVLKVLAANAVLKTRTPVTRAVTNVNVHQATAVVNVPKALVVPVKGQVPRFQCFF